MALDFSPLKVLIIDDSKFMRVLLRDVLVALGFNVDNIRFASDGEAALEMLRDFRFDFLICDINMKPMNGKRFTKHIRTSPETWEPTIPIIICTGHAEIEHIRDARDAGADEILRKPINVLNLYERIRAIIERPRPFIESANYIGPDRRRTKVPYKGEERRQVSPLEV
jgi:CheY-like chemotaxis protein